MHFYFCYKNYIIIKLNCTSLALLDFYNRSYTCQITLWPLYQWACLVYLHRIYSASRSQFNYVTTYQEARLHLTTFVRMFFYILNLRLKHVLFVAAVFAVNLLFDVVSGEFLSRIEVFDIHMCALARGVPVDQLGQ